MAFLTTWGPLLAAGKPVDFQALDQSFIAGWLTLITALGILGFFVAHAPTVRRFAMRVEDPRPLALVRIGLGICVMGNILEMWEHYEYLFMDQGIFPDEVARHVRARKQFAGFGEGIAAGEPVGFFGFDAFLNWLKGPNYSLLLFDSSPAFFWAHWAAFMIATTMCIVGWKTRWTKWAMWFLFNSIIMRNALFWEGTENVYRTLTFYLCLSRCGDAYSVDNWLRRRRLREAGRLSEPGGPGDGAGLAPCEAHPGGLEPFYQAVPFWPRLLMMMQLCVMYLCTGVLKNGNVWFRGDAMYYAFNLDHFYRMPPQLLSSWLGVNMFRVNTHVTHFWESGFPLVFLGLVIRWVRRERPDSGLTPRGQRLARLSATVGYLGFWALVIALIPARYKQGKKLLAPEEVMMITAAGAVIGTALLAVAIRQLRANDRKLRDGDPSVEALALNLSSARRWALGLVGRAGDGPRVVLPMEVVTHWLFGRRLWLGLGLIFHGHLILLMNIGWFSPVVLAGYAAFFNGAEVGRVVDRVTLPLARKLGWSTRTAPIPVADPVACCRRYTDNLAIPRRAMFAVMAAMAVGIFWHASTMPAFAPTVNRALKIIDTKFTAPEAWSMKTTTIHAGWYVVYSLTMLVAVAVRQAYGWRVRPWGYSAFVLVAAACGALRHFDIAQLGWGVPLVLLVIIAASAGSPATETFPIPERDPVTGRARVGWNAGPITRALAGLVLTFQVIAVGIWVYPSGAAYDRFRAPAHQSVGPWIRTTQTTQGWSMFAPNPPRRNVFMQVIVTDKEGVSWDLQTDVYACFQQDASEETCDATYPTPWVFYSRTRKMNRRVVGSEGGKGSWYQKWHARYVCREWARDHGGELPEKVQLVKVSYPIPSPARVWRNGPYDPKTHYNRHKRHNVVHTVKCATEQMGQLSPELSDRYGIPEDSRPHFRSFPRKTCRAWENRLKKEAKDRGEEIEDDDPRFSVCLDDGKDDPKGKTQGARTQGAKPQGAKPTRTRGNRPRGNGVDATPSSAAGVDIPSLRRGTPAQLRPTPETAPAAPAAGQPVAPAAPAAGQPAALAPPAPATQDAAPSPASPSPEDRR